MASVLQAVLRQSTKLPATVIFVLLFSVLTARGGGLLVPSSPSANARTMLEMQERSRSLNISLTAAGALVKERQVFFNPSRRAIEFIYALPLPRDARLETSSRPLVECDNSYSCALDYARNALFPALLACTGGRLYFSKPFTAAPHHPWSVETTAFIPAETVSTELLYKIPFRRIGPPSVPLRRISVTVRARGHFAEQLESFTHTFKPPAPRGWLGMSFYQRDCIPEEDIVICASRRRGAPVRSLAFSDIDGTWLRSRIVLPRIWRKSVKRKQRLAVLFVIDVSGTMRGSRLESVLEGIEDCLEKFDDRDKFNIISFSLVPRSFHHEFISAGEDAKKRAKAFLENLEGFGGTNFGETIQQAGELLAGAPPGIPLRLFLVMDGKADVGIIEPRRLLQIFQSLVPRNTMLEIICIGDNVDARLFASMIRHCGGRLHFTTARDEPRDAIESAFSSTLPQYPNIDFSIETNNNIIPTISNVRSASFGESPLVITGRLKKNQAETLDFSATIKDIRGSVKRVAHSTCTAAISTTCDAVGEYARTVYTLPHISSMVESAEIPRRLPTLPPWMEARLRRILQVPPGNGQAQRISEIAGASGAEVLKRHQLLACLSAFGTFLPRAFYRCRFRRFGKFVFFRERRGRWIQLPYEHSKARKIVYGGMEWTRLVHADELSRSILSLGRKIRFRSSIGLVEIVPTDK